MKEIFKTKKALEELIRERFCEKKIFGVVEYHEVKTLEFKNFQWFLDGEKLDEHIVGFSSDAKNFGVIEIYSYASNQNGNMIIQNDEIINKKIIVKIKKDWEK